MLKQLNALKAKTKISKEAEKLLKLTYRRQSTLAGKLCGSLEVILVMIEKLEKEYDKLEKELKTIDGMDEVEFLKHYGLLSPQGDYIKNITEVDKK